MFEILLSTTIKLNPFNVRVLVMHRWFDIANAERDLKFKPIIPHPRPRRILPSLGEALLRPSLRNIHVVAAAPPRPASAGGLHGTTPKPRRYEDGWTETIQWFKDNWLPKFENKGIFGIAKQSQAKIDIQEASRQKDLSKAKAA